MIFSRPGPDARFFFFLIKRFLNLGGRGRAADQTLASEPLVPLRPESGIPDRLNSDECVFPCVIERVIERKRRPTSKNTQQPNQSPKEQVQKSNTSHAEETCRLRAGSCLLYTSPSPRDKRQSRMPSSA